MMKFNKYILFVLTLSILIIGCGESTKIYTDDWFGISGKVMSSHDSTALKGVKVTLTNFCGNPESVITDKIQYSDSLGIFENLITTGIVIVKENGNETTHKVDSCTAIFSKTGFIDKQIVLKEDVQNENIYLQIQ